MIRDKTLIFKKVRGQTKYKVLDTKRNNLFVGEIEIISNENVWYFNTISNDSFYYSLDLYELIEVKEFMQNLK